MIDVDKVMKREKIYADPGGNTAVYKGVYSPVNQSGISEQHQVAIKELKFNNQDFISGVLQEIIIQTRLEDCPYICRCFGYYQQDSKICIVSELLECDLDSHMKKQKPQKFPEETLMKWLCQVLIALQYAKKKVTPSQSIAHRDLKPQNLLLTSSGDVKLVDFGSGAVSDGNSHKLTGTPLYMSPEYMVSLKEFQASGKLPDLGAGMNHYQADVYSLGVTFLHLALTEPPIRMLIDDRNAAVQTYIGQIASCYPCLHWYLTRMLAHSPEARLDFDSLLSYMQHSQSYQESTHSEAMTDMTQAAGTQSYGRQEDTTVLQHHYSMQTSDPQQSPVLQYSYSTGNPAYPDTYQPHEEKKAEEQSKEQAGLGPYESNQAQQTYAQPHTLQQ